jgi:hypothetical protein
MIPYIIASVEKFTSKKVVKTIQAKREKSAGDQKL